MACQPGQDYPIYTGFVAAFTRQQRFLLTFLPPLASALIRVLGATLRYRDVSDSMPDGSPVPAGHTLPGPSIFAFWHCSLLACAHRFRGLGIAILISQSFDGELIARTVERLGFLPVRGSSTRGGPLALMGMAEAYGAGHICAFTADGPRGPARVAKPGPVHLAQLTSCFAHPPTWLGAFHAQPSRAWYLHSWDRFMIPKPFTAVTFTWPAHVAPELRAIQSALERAVLMGSHSSSTGG